MSILATIFVVIVAVEHLYIMYLETIATTSKKTAETFNIKQQVLKDKNIQTLLKNQGIYNGLLALSLFYGAFLSSNPKEFVAVLLIFIILAAIYGSLTSSKSIILKQGGPAILALILLLI
ncbi:DUF1304 domain-containing protein [Mammaliicoccus sciuri]|uniref:DUF1304 domain-containing protein n=1 Tax=Mammaliicoccus sciuri TaxID=1296 RepID=A0AAI8DGB8_MAMSC|nr:DUF1304 domain-containing protein [Mammaliicoccus sciuri]OOV38232.1 hypothetical protein BS756_05850 [Staphylococcus sp. MB371]ASE33257.1 DUF1304 domain-containing protein [Mammaliicoccus sciuri]KTT84269.1 membrane protein [Mammaliicoccus sciuri]KTT86853.1 membrane protein [Mammaliicoccus sciuri]KTT87425.1 membrane protein [Mammaliicoccus sciuri]